jgi:hypothetical protein
VEAKGEVLNPLIGAAPPNAVCQAAANERPCIKTTGVVIDSYPDDWQCPCHADGSSGGAIEGDGTPTHANPDNGEFVEEVLVSGFTNPVRVRI